jgi:hypothetical protein
MSRAASTLLNMRLAYFLIGSIFCWHNPSLFQSQLFCRTLFRYQKKRAQLFNTACIYFIETRFYRIYSLSIVRQLMIWRSLQVCWLVCSIQKRFAAILHKLLRSQARIWWVSLCTVVSSSLVCMWWVRTSTWIITYRTSLCKITLSLISIHVRVTQN